MREQVYAAEYSYKQNAFHIDWLNLSLAHNLRAVSGKTGNDFMIFHIGTYEKCREMIDNMKAIHDRGEYDTAVNCICKWIPDELGNWDILHNHKCLIHGDN